MRLRRSPLGWAAAAAVTVAALMPVAVADFARAATPVELIRTYNSDLRGVVFEVCRGSYDPPATDPLNPVYCDGEVEYWSQERWQRFNRRRGSSGGSGQPSGGSSGGGSESRGPTVAVGEGSGEEPSAPAVPYGGSLDPTSVLDVRNPLCGRPGELSAAQLRNCRSSGSPEAGYPVGNYGWDIHIESGGFISSVFAPAVTFVLQLLSVLWLLLLLVLKGCLIVLGFVFSLSPFTDNSMLREIDVGLSRFYRGLTSPWLVTLFVVIGVWGLYNGIVRRRAGETLGAILAALAMMLGAMWVIHSPRDTIGRVAEAVNSASLTAVAAPAAGSARASVRSYNDAMASVWDQFTAIPFCAMDFSDVRWCMEARPSEEALLAARSGLDDGDAFTRQLLSELPDDDERAARRLRLTLAALFGEAPTIRDLYLRFSPAGGPRDALWEHYNGKPDEHVGLPLDVGPQLNVGGGTSGAAPEKVSMQGRSGILARLVMLLFFLIGLLGGLALLLWIAMRLMMASTASFILVLAAPLAMFLPAFGQTGRDAFAKWLTSLVGAIVAKLLFSALLGVVLLGSSVIGKGVGGSSPTLGLIASMAFWWAALLTRERFLAIFNLDPIRDRDLGIYRALAGGYLGYRAAKAAKNAIGNRLRDHRERVEHREADHARGRHAAADRTLDEQAERRLDASRANAEARDSSHAAKEREARSLREDPEVRAHRAGEGLDEEGRDRAQRKAERLRGLEDEIAAERPHAQADRQLLRRVRGREAAGLPPYERGDVEGAREAIRRELHLPADAPEHRWRAQAAGSDPETPEGREAIERSLAASREAVGAIPEQRLRQVDLHRPRQSMGGQRRPTSGLRRRQADGSAAKDPDSGAGRPTRPERRSRLRDWLSR